MAISLPNGEMMTPETRSPGGARGRALALMTLLTAFAPAACGDSDATSGDAAAAAGDGAADGADAGRDGTADGSDAVDGADADGALDGSNGADGADAAVPSDAGSELDAAIPADGGSSQPDGGTSDAGDTDAGVEQPVTVGPESAAVIPLSATGHDRLYGVTFDADGKILATGHVADSTDASADFSIAVVRFLANGTLDTTFGSGGITRVNASVGGKSAEIARGIVVQSTGKIVVVGAAEHDPSAAGVLANDTDVVLVRLLADGTPDESFGTNGIVRHDFGTGYESTNASGAATLAAADAPWSLGLAAGDKLVVHAAARAPGNVGDTGTPRTDTDWLLVRLTADGALDEGFGDQGKVWLDIGLANASARAATVLPDGSVLGSGYTTTDVLSPGTTTQQPVIYKVTPTGEFDETFATSDAWGEPGVYFDFTVAPPARAEAYGAALQGDHLVTMGYGPTRGTGTGTDFVSFRFSDTGELDTTYGVDGASWIDAGGYGDNGRSLVVLPDGRVLGIGGGRAAPAEPPAMGTTPPSDGMLVLLSEHGQPETSFGNGGFRLLDFEGGTSDFLWAGALAPDQSQVAVVGLRGFAAANDDAALVLIPLR